MPKSNRKTQPLKGPYTPKTPTNLPLDAYFAGEQGSTSVSAQTIAYLAKPPSPRRFPEYHPTYPPYDLNDLRPELEDPRTPSPTYAPSSPYSPHSPPVWGAEPDYSGSDPLKKYPYRNGDYSPSSPPYSPTKTWETTEKGLKQVVEKYPVLGRLLTIGRQQEEPRLIKDWMATEMKAFCDELDNN